jgi:hypothetical protein
MQESVETLESQLAEKEQLVAALTERLEQAAEQLDRLHRTGADRALRAGFAGIPPELIQQQQKLVDDLQRAVQQWEDMQPGAFFGRLESQLAHIQELVRYSDRSGGERSSGSSSFSDHAESEHGGAERGNSRRSSSDSPQSILSFLKSGLQSEAAADESPKYEEAASPTSPAASVAVEIALPPLQEAPEAIDSVNASQTELAAACERRDSYIIYLLQRLRQVESRGYVPNSWAGLENMPAELRQRLEVLERRLQETLRLAEVELSLQRAKLAREEARVKSMDDQMQKELRRARDANDSHEEEERRGDESSAGGRWRRMLGRRGESS